jgi:aryl-alcohol dehydrogenase-like predicted oxidoreductase
VAALGLGGAWLGVGAADSPEAQDEAAAAAIHRAIELGMDYLDTSPLYGESERRVGLALSQPHPAGGTWRERMRLVTKTGTHPARRGDYSAAATRWSVENSLRMLRTGYLDGVLVHDPPDMGPVLQSGGAAEELVRLKEEGGIGAVGIGVQGHALLRAAIRDGRFDLIQTTYDYTLLRTSAAEAVLPEAHGRHLAVVNASPYLSGLLAAGSEEQMEGLARERPWACRPGDLERARMLFRWAVAEGVDLAALAVQFSLREERFAATLVGPRDVTEVKRNVEAALTPISEETWTRLASVLRSPGSLSG